MYFKILFQEKICLGKGVASFGSSFIHYVPVRGWQTIPGTSPSQLSPWERLSGGLGSLPTAHDTYVVFQEIVNFKTQQYIKETEVECCLCVFCTCLVLVDSGDRQLSEGVGQRFRPAPEVEGETAFFWRGLPAWCGQLPALFSPADRLQETWVTAYPYMAFCPGGILNNFSGKRNPHPQQE